MPFTTYQARRSSLSSASLFSIFHGSLLPTISILCLFRMHLNRNIVIVIEYWERRQTGLGFSFHFFLSPVVLFFMSSPFFSSTSFCHGHVGTLFSKVNSSIIISSARLNAIRASAFSPILSAFVAKFLCCVSFLLFLEAPLLAEMLRNCACRRSILQHHLLLLV